MEKTYTSDYPPLIRGEWKEHRFDLSITTMRNEQSNEQLRRQRR